MPQTPNFSSLPPADREKLLQTLAEKQAALHWRNKIQAQGVAAFGITLTPRQQEAWAATDRYRYVLYGGARGGGKSFLLRWRALYQLIELWLAGFPKARNAIFCDTYVNLQDRHIGPIAAEFPEEIGQLKESRKYGLGFHLIDDLGGGILQLRNLDKPEKYKSAEFAGIYPDELTTQNERVFNVLRGSLRWKRGARTLFFAGTNPDGIGHLWVKSLWINHDFPPQMVRTGLDAEFHFVKSLPSDNPHLDEAYWRDLDSQPEEIRRAWVEGDWDLFEGQVFKNFRKDRHVVTPEDFPIPESWPRVQGIDWGNAAPWAVLWLAMDPDTGRYIVYRELYERGLTDRQQARRIKANELENENIRFRFADPAMWAARNHEDVVFSSADEYARAGVRLTKANNARIDGLRKVMRLLEDLPDGRPGLLMYEDCRSLIRTLPALPHDKRQIEDVDTNAEDHAYDALRYALSNAVTREQKKQHRDAKQRGWGMRF